MSADIAAVLEAHTYDYPDSFCECGHFVGARPWKDHAAHVAEQLAPVITAAQAEALREAKHDIGARIKLFRRLNADGQYLSALNDAWGLLANRERVADRIGAAR